MRLDQRGFPHIAWGETQTGKYELKYSFWDGLQWAWHDQPVVDWTESNMVWSSNMLDLDDEHRPILAASRRENDLRVLSLWKYNQQWIRSDFEVDYDVGWVGVLRYTPLADHSSSSSSTESSSSSLGYTYSSSSSSSFSSLSSSSEESRYLLYGAEWPTFYNGYYYPDGTFNGGPSYANKDHTAYIFRCHNFFTGEWYLHVATSKYSFTDIYGNPYVNPEPHFESGLRSVIAGPYMPVNGAQGGIAVRETFGNTSSSSSSWSSESSSSWSSVSISSSSISLQSESSSSSPMEMFLSVSGAGTVGANGIYEQMATDLWIKPDGYIIVYDGITWQIGSVNPDPFPLLYYCTSCTGLTPPSGSTWAIIDGALPVPSIAQVWGENSTSSSYSSSDSSSYSSVTSSSYSSSSDSSVSSNSSVSSDSSSGSSLSLSSSSTSSGTSSSSSSFDDARNIVMVYDVTNYCFRAYHVIGDVWAPLGTINHTLTRFDTIHAEVCNGHIVIGCVDEPSSAESRVVVNFFDVMGESFVWTSFVEITDSLTNGSLVDVDISGYAFEDISAASVAWITQDDQSKVCSSYIDVNGIQRPSDSSNVLIMAKDIDVSLTNDFLINAYRKVQVAVNDSFRPCLLCLGAKNTYLAMDVWNGWKSNSVGIIGVGSGWNPSVIDTDYDDGMQMVFINDNSDVYYLQLQDVASHDIVTPDMTILNYQWCSHQKYRDGSLNGEDNLERVFNNRTGAILRSGSRSCLVTSSRDINPWYPPIPESSSSSSSTTSSESISSDSTPSSQSISISLSSLSSTSSSSTSSYEFPCTAEILPVMTGNITPAPYIVVGGETATTYDAWHAVGSTYPGARWNYGEGVTGGSLPRVVFVDLGASNSQVVCSYLINYAFGSGSLDGTSVYLAGIALDGSTDGVNWQTLHSYGGVMGYSGVYTFSFTNTEAYRYYLLSMTASNFIPPSTWLSLVTFQLYGRLVPRTIRGLGEDILQQFVDESG
jgi:hypothetical protein